MKQSNRLHPFALAAAACLLAACGGGGEAPLASASAGGTLGTTGSLDGRALSLTLSRQPLSAAPAGLSGSVRCAGLEVGSATLDNLEVPAGSICRLEGTVVRGSVQVASDAMLIASGVRITGSVQGEGARHVQITGPDTRIGGNFILEGGGSGTLTGTLVAGNVQVKALDDVVLLQDNRVDGNLQFTDNRGGGAIQGNRISGNLQCTGNLPLPLTSGNFAASLEDQCRLPTGDPTGGGGGAGVVPVPGMPAPSGNVTCVNITLGTVRVDNVIVPAGAQCTLIGTRLNGTLEVQRGARVTAENITVNGNLQSDGAADLRIVGDSRVGGSVQVQRGAAASIIGLAITGDLQVDAMAGPVFAAANRIGGNLQAFGNRGGVTLELNTMNGTLQCQENAPAPVGSRNVATLKENQCRGL